MGNNIYEEIPENSDKEIFEELFKNKNVHIERITSFGCNSPENFWFNQPTDEWVILLNGEAELEFRNNIKQKLIAGDYLFIPAFKEHRVNYVSKEPNCIWLAVHINNEQ